MKLSLPKLYPITDTGITGLTHLEQVRRLADGGATIIQLRDKVASPREFYESAVEVMKLVRGSNVQIIINDRVDIAIAAGADGVHLGQDDLSPAAARSLLGNEKIIGFSTHSTQQALLALQLPIDYAAIGPINATTTKSDTDPVVGLHGLQAVRSAIGDFPLVAIGGISHENAREILASGATSLAVISAVLSDPAGISSRFRQIVEHL